MTSEFQDNFKTLHAAALTLSTQMLAAMPQVEIDAMARAVKHGARILMQLGPLPDCGLVELTLLEREGKRHCLCKLVVMQ